MASPSHESNCFEVKTELEGMNDVKLEIMEMDLGTQLDEFKENIDVTIYENEVPVPNNSKDPLDTQNTNRVVKCRNVDDASNVESEMYSEKERYCKRRCRFLQKCEHFNRRLSSSRRVRTPPLQHLSSESKSVHPAPNYMVQILQLLRTVHSELKSQREAIERIERRLSQDDANSEEDEELEFELPCHSIVDLENLNDLLKEELTRRKLIHKLSLLGGRDSKQVVNLICGELISHKLSLTMNVTGAKNKLPLKTHDGVVNVIIDSVRKHASYKSITERDVIVLIGRWFTGARDRNGGRSKNLSFRNQDKFTHTREEEESVPPYL